MTVFVGRVDELRTLAETGKTALRGHATAAMIVGDPGSGKSRLLTEAPTRSELRNQFRSVGYEAEIEVPLAAASDLLRTLANVTPRGHELESVVFDPAHEDVSPLEPLRVFEATHRALHAMGPALVLVDDLQWVDDLSLALSHYLVRAAETSGQSLALIAVARPSAVATSFAASLGQLLPDEHLTTIELEPLSEAEALELVGALVPGVDNDAANALVGKSGGSPFWLEALVRTGGAGVDAGRMVTAQLRGASADAR